MEPEYLVMNLSSQAAAALAVLALTHRTLSIPNRIPAIRRMAARRPVGRQLWKGIARRWLPDTGNAE